MPRLLRCKSLHFRSRIGGTGHCTARCAAFTEVIPEGCRKLDRLKKNYSRLFHGIALSLTPALSRWEREKRSLRFGITTAEFSRMTHKFYEPIQPLFPLPAGEGQGEGECRTSQDGYSFSRTALKVGRSLLRRPNIWAGLRLRRRFFDTAEWR